MSDDLIKFEPGEPYCLHLIPVRECEVCDEIRLAATVTARLEIVGVDTKTGHFTFAGKPQKP